MCEIAQYWNKNWSEWEHDSGPSSFAQKVYAVVQNKPYKTFLDLGAGAGRDSCFFAEKGFSVTATDISETALKQIEHPSVQCLCADIRRVIFTGQSFDIVYANLSLHYFDDFETRQIIHNIYKMLSENGLFFIRCKSVKDPLFGQGEKISDNMFKQDHIRHFFDEKYMKEVLSDFSKYEIAQVSENYYGLCHFIDGTGYK